MQIPSFPLPSHLSTIVEFRTPTVEDALMFCDLHDYQEEVNTTRFLNHIQDTTKHPLNDSANWTGSDRRTALWWIFLATSELDTLPFSFECGHCKENHYRDLHMAELMEDAIALNGLPKNEIRFDVKGVEMVATVSPLRGWQIEHLEQLRCMRDSYDQNSLEHKQLSNDMSLHELAYCLNFSNEPEDRADALVWKLDTLKSMYLNTEFRKAFVLVEQAQRETRHGLLTKYEDGRYYLVAKVAECEELVKQGGEATRLLLLPFRNNDFIATF